MLGTSLKNLTSSHKIIDIIHLYSHCISYTRVEELEIEVTYTSVQKLNVCPELIKNHHICEPVLLLIILIGS